MKRIILVLCAVLAAVLLLSGFLLTEFCSYATTAGTHATDSNAVYTIAAGDIPHSASSGTQPSEMGAILSMCEFLGEEQHGDQTIKQYDGTPIAEYTARCKEITDISEMNGYLYIFYTTTDNKEVILTYTDEGLQERIIYDAAKDTAFIERNGSAELVHNFREGLPLAPCLWAAAAFLVISIGACAWILFRYRRRNPTP